MTAVQILALATLCGWLLLALDRRRAWPSDLLLTSTVQQPPPTAQGRVVALVPARDESSVLDQTLPSLLNQEGVDLQVVLIDDRSTDGTAELARRLAERCGRSQRLRVLETAERPTGWSGKVHALHTGLEELLERQGDRPDWLLLTDADIQHRPDSLRSLLIQAGTGGDREDRDLVSVMARLRTESRWEKLIVPAFVFFFQLLYPFRRVNDDSGRLAAAAGGCILVRLETLLQAGGFEVVAGEIIDDVALGRAVKSSGGRVWLGFDPGIVSRRPYDSLGGLWRMIRRTAFTQLRYRRDLLIGTLLALLVFLVLPPLLALLSVPLGVAAGRAAAPWLWTAGLSLLSWAVMSWLYRPAVRHHGLGAGWAFTLPLAGLFFGLMTADSAVRHWRGRGAAWRGRTYQRSGPVGTPPSR